MIALVRTADRSYYGESDAPLMPRYYWTATLLPPLTPSSDHWVAPVYLGGSLDAVTGELTGSSWTESSGSSSIPATQADLATKVSKSGDEIISGNKSFTGDTSLSSGESLGLFEVLTALLTDNTQQAASTSFVQGLIAKFGLGTIDSPLYTNANNIVNNTLFRLSASSTGGPIAATTTVGINVQYGSTAAVQLVVIASSTPASNGRVFTRSKISSVWGTWTEVLKVAGTWTALPLASGFTAGSTVPSYRVTGDGCVQFRGRVVITALLAANTLKTLATLPAGARATYLSGTEPVMCPLLNATTGVGCYASGLATGVLSLGSTAGFAASDVIDIGGLQYPTV